jgi:ubiquinone/menaquinone biosynthesis C-methylase UbiE
MIQPSAHLQQIATLFDQWASSDRAAQMATGHQPLMTALLGEIIPQGALLDLGCGTGAFLAQAQLAGFDPTYGIDASAEMLATAQHNAPSAKLHLGSFENLPWSMATFDQVTSIEALYYCPDPGLALQEVARVLKPGGRFDLIIDFYAESTGTETWPQGVGFELTRLATGEWGAIAQQAGLTVVRQQRILPSQPEALQAHWQPSVWFPTLAAYRNYLENGAFWLAALR